MVVTRCICLNISNWPEARHTVLESPPPRLICDIALHYYFSHNIEHYILILMLPVWEGLNYRFIVQQKGVIRVQTSSKILVVVFGPFQDFFLTFYASWAQKGRSKSCCELNEPTHQVVGGSWPVFWPGLFFCPVRWNPNFCPVLARVNRHSRGLGRFISPHSSQSSVRPSAGPRVDWRSGGGKLCWSPPGHSCSRVEHSHWSRIIEILCSDWWNFTMLVSRSMP